MSNADRAKKAKEGNFFYQDERAKKHRNPYHFDNELLIVMDVEISDPNPAEGSLTALKFMPVEGMNFEMSEVFPPLAVEEILPNKLDTYRPRFRGYPRTRMVKVLKDGIPFESANHILLDWVKALKLAPKARLVPVCFDWNEYRPFIIELCGGYETFKLLFNERKTIDINVIQNYLEDLAWNNSEKYPFNYKTPAPENSVIKKLEVVRVNPINTYARCMDLANAFKKLRTLSLPKGIDIR